MPMITAGEQEILRILWTHGRMSRWELHERTGLTPNRIGTLADTMIANGLVREGAPQAAKAGRPRVPLEIDPSGRHIIGLVIAPGRVQMCRLGLGGQLIELLPTKEIADPDHLLQAAAQMVGKAINSRTLSIGVTVPGFLDPQQRTILFSGAMPGRSSVSLAPIYDAAGTCPVILGNDMHALAARWLLLHRAEQHQDVLLAWFTDGRFGSAMLINGRPNRGCATAGNELGHTRFFVDTQKCFCGHTGCLERIVSTDFLDRQDRISKRRKVALSLTERAAQFEAGNDSSIVTLLEYLSCSLANAANFVRPHRLVLASPLTRHTSFANQLTASIRQQLLPELADRVRIDNWDLAANESAESAAWLAIADLLLNGWNAASASGDPAAIA